MYIKRCIYCGKEFESVHPNKDYCSKHHASKAREVRYKMKKARIIKPWTGDPINLVDIIYLFREPVYDEIKSILEKY